MSIVNPSTERPTVVLVHGAFAESASWNAVLAHLQAEGYPTIAMANPLRGVAHDATHLRALLSTVSGDVVLVGHSYGGLVISEAAEGNARVTALVFICAFAALPGESAADLSNRFPGGTLGETLVAIPLPDGETDLYIAQDRYHDQFAADSSPEDAAVMASTQRPITESALNEPAGAAAWTSIPSWFLFGSDDKNIPVESHRFMAERAHSRRTVELAGGSHTVGIPESAQVVDLIKEAAGNAPAR
ncbi:alpha/beta fold hydrolase [Herbiconiux ginsengi]|uniref:Pimeloyl-ACP methyl ester carboxylesterase n=1 Tax=Herbiconiux ginsengi TaxID=381665 RepID=A0A1H3S5D3_9MICO|nr:alpha/beta hydrolase [Herbiconiux ginsengi]SDZ32339.1 Pimeloyl-ACP methyl ester carboxylesterase [Herbiconiux ginsengi]